MAGARRRTALAQVGGETTTRGETSVARELARALTAVEGVADDALTHGFHTYPARMHHRVARAVLEQGGSMRGLVLDPFCGSGTVLIESMLVGTSCVGVDLNPFALRLARVKCEVRGADERAEFVARLERVAECSRQRVRKRVDVRAPISACEARWYDGHVLKELAGLHREILAEPDGADRRALVMVFSAILTKFSRQQADTAERRVERRIGKGLVTDFFVRKGAELARRWAELERAVPAGWRAPELVEGDARELATLVGDARFGLVLGSPPYGGTYDYVDHHARRLAWLGLDASALRDREVGARRNLRGNKAALRRWDDEVRGVLGAIHAVLEPGGRCVLLFGDGSIGRRRVPADEQVERLGREVGLELVAVASQRRRDFTGGPRRREHLIALTRG